jgi:hypothetical protein
MHADKQSLESRYGVIAAAAILDEIRKVEESRIIYFAPRARRDGPEDKAVRGEAA